MVEADNSAVLQAFELYPVGQGEGCHVFVIRLHLDVRIIILFSAVVVHTLSVCSYFRHFLNWVILYSVWFEFHLMPFVFSCTRMILR